jgi:polyisoprenoid-binding protein YceI
VCGEITIRDRTHGTVFQVDTSSPVIDGQRRHRSQATATGTFSRREWGLTWDRILRFGGLLVADEVDFSLNIDAAASSPAPHSARP